MHGSPSGLAQDLSDLRRISGESGREAHLKGRVAAKLTEIGSELFANPLELVRVEVIADKLPQ